MITRRLVELALLAALVPVGVVGVQSWRAEESPATPASVPPRATRPQLGRSVPARLQSPGVLPVIDGDRVPFATADEDTTVHPTSVRVEATAPRAPQGAAAMVVASMRQALSDPRAPEPSPARGAAGGLPAGAGPVTAAAGAASAPGPLALVDFTGIMQDETLLKRYELPAELVRQLKITVSWNIAGGHAQRLELFTPDGVFYQRFARDFTGSGGSRTAVDTLVPVGGSWITEYSLFGAWRVDVYLDGQRTPTTTASFILNR